MKSFEMSLSRLNLNSGTLVFKGYADDDEIDARKTSNSGPGFYLSFNFDRNLASELGEELIRVGAMLKAIKE